MDGWGDAPDEAEARTWLAMDLLAPVHELWALEVVPGPGGEAPAAVQALTEGLLGEHRPELTEAALAGLVDLERALVVGAALEVARRLVAPEVLVVVECALVDEACRLSLLPLVNAAADLLVELERDAVQDEFAQGEVAQDGTGKEAAEPEAGQRAPDGSVGSADPACPADLADPAVVGAPVPAEAAAGVRCDERAGRRVGARSVWWRGSALGDRGRGPARRPVVAARAAGGGTRTRGPPPGRSCSRRWGRAHADRPGAWGQGPRSQSSR